MEIQLTAIEARVLGCLVEKEVTTPDYYPLSLSGLTTACNQKSNRDPVMSLSESEAMTCLDGLIAHRLVWEKTPSGSRVTKYAHRLRNTLGLTFSFSDNELGVLCMLMLRGPQTVGEIRGRTGRLCQFSNLEEVEQILHALATREEGPYVVQLAREPGRKESRFMHLLCGEVEAATVAPSATAPPPYSVDSRVPQQDDRLSALEAEVARLRTEMDDIKQQLFG